MCIKSLLLNYQVSLICSKYPSYVSILTFQLTGCAFLAIGLWILLVKHSYASLLGNSTFPAATYLMIGIGAFIIITGIMGCAGARVENRCTLVLVSDILMVRTADTAYEINPWILLKLMNIHVFDTFYSLKFLLVELLYMCIEQRQIHVAFYIFLWAFCMIKCQHCRIDFPCSMLCFYFSFSWWKPLVVCWPTCMRES